MSEDEFSPAFSSAFDAEFPGANNTACIEVDWSCRDDLSTFTTSQIEIAELFAQRAIQILTGFQYGNCPVTVRPCAARCADQTFLPGSGTPWMTPFIRDGRWYNSCGCPQRGCSCVEMQVIHLQSRVGEILEVKVDGQILDPTLYRVDNGDELVRLDGEAWPSCQDMNLEDTAEDTMSVTYVPGGVLGRAGQFVAGKLASEYLQLCEGKKCALPSSVQTISRQGVTFQMGSDIFPGNRTGIISVDLWVQSVNPYGAKVAPRVHSPDIEPVRQTTWRA